MSSTTSSRLLFGGVIFLASFLLFLVEPMAAKQLLPVFGGSAAVWITCLVFFQSALLCAYLYAHWLAASSRQQTHSWNLHLTLLLAATASALLWTALQPASQAFSASTHPILAIFTALALSIGLPFLALGATSPLLQVWFSRVESSGVPYRLFALSNLASLLALGLYPTLVEPNFTLHTQRLLWASGFLLFALLSAYLTWKTRSATQTPINQPAVPIDEAPPTPLPRKLLWLLLPMGAAMQLSAITSHLTENIAAIPLLWVLPLAVYLITLILAFQFPRLQSRFILTRLLAVLLASLGYMLSQPEGSLPLKIGLPFVLVELFVAALFCHTEAVNLRPARDSEVTLFYLLFAAGGALGSFLIGIASPLIFNFNYDLALTYLVTALLAAFVLWNTGWGPRLLWTTAAALLLGLCFFLHIAFARNTPVAVRNFYGSLRVKQTVGYPGATIRTLTNGTIQHGTQIFTEELRQTPTTYYAPDSGIGLALTNCCPGRSRHIGVVGLGTGTVAAYGQSGDSFRFYEINPAVAPIAQNLFNYMRDAQARGAQITVVEGDARTSLARELADHQPQNFDVLVVDAFSGDAIPLHLLTTQAIALYKQHLAPGGVLAIHISNQHVDLEPEVAQLAHATGLQAMRVSTPTNPERGEFSATWMLLSANTDFFAIPNIFNNAHAPHENLKLRPWTDDYSSLLPILRW